MSRKMGRDLVETRSLPIFRLICQPSCFSFLCSIADAAVDFAAVVEQNGPRLRFAADVVGIGQAHGYNGTRAGVLLLPGWCLRWFDFAKILANRAAHSAPARQPQDCAQKNAHQDTYQGGWPYLDALDAQIDYPKGQTAQDDAKNDGEKR